MVRRIVLTAGLVALTAGAAAAMERATFIMNDGTRHSGLVVFHGSQNNNIIDDYANLNEGGKEQTYPVGQIAIIEFSGEPAAADFQGMPASGDYLVLRSGAKQGGTLENMVGGETVQWKNEAGQLQQYAIADVARIYMNPDAARRLYPQFASVGTAGTQQTQQPAPTPSNAGQAVPRGAIRVPANQQWTSTGVRVKKGQQLVFNASGQVQVSPNPEQVSGPDGNPEIPSPNLPVGIMGVGGLIGKVGLGQPFAIGNSGQPITMPDDGLLMLGVNDTNLNDNSGYFDVRLSMPLR
jgi:hypothetical protein